MRRQQAEAVIGSSRIPFVVTRSRNRATVSISVHPNGDVAVLAPKGSRLSLICERVSQKGKWILEQQEQFRQLQQTTPRRLISGESLYYMGRQYKLKIRLTHTESASPAVRMLAGRFDVTIPTKVHRDDHPSLVRTLLRDWYRERALSALTLSSIRYADLLGLDAPDVRVRAMSRRWGSADPTGRLTYNWQVVMAPRRLLEYVVAHEICHLIHNNHSKDFWRLLERVMPDYEDRRIELAITGTKFRM